MTEHTQLRIDTTLLDELRPMKNNELRSINAVIWHLKRHYDKTKRR